MKKHLLAITIGVITTLSVFTSCKKDKDNGSVKPEITNVNCLPISMEYSDTSTIQLKYDSEGRLVKMNSYDKDNNDDGSYTYTYSPGKLFEVFESVKNNYKYEREHFLNENGSVSYTYEKEYTEWGNGYDTTYYKYDSEGRNVLIIYHGKDSLIKSYSNGNLVSSIDINSNGERRTSTYTYSPYENKLNILEGEVLISGFYGKGSKNLVSKEVEVLPNGAIFTSTTDYVVNSEGLITHRTFTVIDSRKPNENYYFVDHSINYDCK